MKSWITYLISILLGLASAVAFGAVPEFKSTVFGIMKILVNVGGFVLLPVIICSFSAGVASLRKDRLGGKMSSSVAIWTLLTVILLPLFASLAFFIVPAVFPIKQSGKTLTYLTMNALNSAGGQMQNSGMLTSTMFIPLILFAWLIGWLLKPSSDTIRPAYAVMNSFSEVMYRLTRAYTFLGYIFAYFASAVFFTTQLLSENLTNGAVFLSMVAGASAFLVIVVLPLIFSCLTAFRINPYPVILSAFPSASLGFMTGNIVMATPVLLTTSRRNDGVQKRITSTALPIMMIFTKGGTAAVAAITMLSLMGLWGIEITAQSIFLVAVVSGFAALVSFTGTGFECGLVVALMVTYLKIDLQGGENAILLLLPILNGFAVFVDMISMALGSKYASWITETDAAVPYGDWI